MTDPIWWLYLFWLADFLQKKHGLSLSGVSAPLVVIYLVADVGSIGGGWLSSALIKRGWSVNAARKTAMLVCALLVVPVMFAPYVDSLWVAVGAGRAWRPPRTRAGPRTSSRSRPTCSRVAPWGRSSGSAAWPARSAGCCSPRSPATSWSGTSSDYLPVFVIAGFAYLTALGVIHLLVPVIKPVELGE